MRTLWAEGACGAVEPPVPAEIKVSQLLCAPVLLFILFPKIYLQTMSVVGGGVFCLLYLSL